MAPIPPFLPAPGPGSREQVTRETVEAVLADGSYRVRGTTVRALTPSVQLKVGEQVPVYWRDGNPYVILAASARRAQTAPKPLVSLGDTETLVAGPSGSLWFRDETHFVRLFTAADLGIDEDLGLFGGAWAPVAADHHFIVFGVKPGESTQTRYVVAKLNRSPGTAYGPGSAPAATIVATYDRFPDTEVGRFQTDVTLEGTTIFGVSEVSNSGGAPTPNPYSLDLSRVYDVPYTSRTEGPVKTRDRSNVLGVGLGADLHAYAVIPVARDNDTATFEESGKGWKLTGVTSHELHPNITEDDTFGTAAVPSLGRVDVVPHFAIVDLTAARVVWTSAPDVDQTTITGRRDSFGQVVVRSNLTGVFSNTTFPVGSLPAAVPIGSPGPFGPTYLMGGHHTEQPFDGSGFSEFELASRFYDPGNITPTAETLTVYNEQGELRHSYFFGLYPSTYWPATATYYYRVALCDSGDAVLATSFEEAASITVPESPQTTILLGWHGFDPDLMASAAKWRIFRSDPDTPGGPYKFLGEVPIQALDTTVVVGFFEYPIVRIDIGDWGPTAATGTQWGPGLARALPPRAAAIIASTTYRLDYKDRFPTGSFDAITSDRFHVIAGVCGATKALELDGQAILGIRLLSVTGPPERWRLFVVVRKYADFTAHPTSPGAVVVVNGLGNLVMALLPPWEASFIGASLLAGNRRYALWESRNLAGVRTIRLSDLTALTTTTILSAPDSATLMKQFLAQEFWFAPDHAVLYAATDGRPDYPAAISGYGLPLDREQLFASLAGLGTVPPAQDRNVDAVPTVKAPPKADFPETVTKLAVHLAGVDSRRV